MNNKIGIILILVILLIITMVSLCCAATPPGPPPSTPLNPPGSIGGMIYAGVVVCMAIVGFWKLRK